MPFQVAYSFKSSPVGVINFFTAGEDQVTVCDTSVDLTATVSGDLTGHTIVWEQVSGTAVTFTTPLNQLSISYTTAIFDDKVFRFTIDKATASEQFDDINIYGAPTHIQQFGSGSFIGVTNFGDALRCPTPAIRLFSDFPLTAHGGVVDCDIPTNPTLFWPTLCDEASISHILIQSRSTTGPWINVATLSADSTSFAPLVLGSSYRVVGVYFSRSGNTLIEYPSNSVYVRNATSRTNNPAIQATESIVMGGTSARPAVTAYATDLLVLVSKPANIHDVALSASPAKPSHVKIIAFNTETLILISKPANIHDVALSASPAKPSQVLITAFDVLVLDGSQVGG